MNKLAVIAAFLALSSCATFSGDPESPEESPDQSPPRESAPSAESEAGTEASVPDVPDAPEVPLPEAPAPDVAGPEPPAEDADGADPPPEDAGDAEALSEPETPPDPAIPRMTSPQRAADEAPALPAPSLPPASDAPAPTAQRVAPESDPGPEPEPPGAEPEPQPEPRPEPAPEPRRAQREPERREPEPQPEPAPEPRRDPRPPQQNDAPATARQPKPEPSLSETRRVAVGDEMRLSLGDGGWVYLGEESGEDGLSFRRRYSEGGDTIFVFSVEEPGDYVVRFQRQDLDRGVFREERVAVDARPEPASADGAERADGAGTPSPQETEGTRVAEVLEEAPEEPPEEAPEEPVPSADLDEAYALFEEGRREAALDAFLQSYPVGDPEVHDLIARLAYELGRWETARSHWSRNLDADEPFSRNARLGLFRTALETDDAEAAWELFRELEEEGRPGPARPADPANPATITGPADAGTDGVASPDISDEELLRLGNLLLESTDPSRAVGPLEAYMDTGGTPDDPAELYYRLGRLYEDRREARAAMEYYRRVVDEFPLSRHWQPAEERVQYLRRHFFDIR